MKGLWLFNNHDQLASRIGNYKMSLKLFSLVKGIELCLLGYEKVAVRFLYGKPVRCGYRGVNGVIYLHLRY